MANENAKKKPAVKLTLVFAARNVRDTRCPSRVLRSGRHTTYATAAPTAAKPHIASADHVRPAGPPMDRSGFGSTIKAIPHIKSSATEASNRSTKTLAAAAALRSGA